MRNEPEKKKPGPDVPPYHTDYLRMSADRLVQRLIEKGKEAGTLQIKAAAKKDYDQSPWVIGNREAIEKAMEAEFDVFKEETGGNVPMQMAIIAESIRVAESRFADYLQAASDVRDSTRHLMGSVLGMIGVKIRKPVSKEEKRLTLDREFCRLAEKVLLKTPDAEELLRTVDLRERESPDPNHVLALDTIVAKIYESMKVVSEESGSLIARPEGEVIKVTGDLPQMKTACRKILEPLLQLSNAPYRGAILYRLRKEVQSGRDYNRYLEGLLAAQDDSEKRIQRKKMNRAIDDRIFEMWLDEIDVWIGAQNSGSDQ